MKKNIFITAVSVVCITLLIGAICYFSTKKDYSKKNEKEYNTLSIMVESDGANGEKKYEVYEGSAFPTEGYILNEEKSGCESGGTLTWNSETKKVIIKSNSTDKCYAYFDKLPEVINE